MTDEPYDMEMELRETFEHLVALLQRRDEVRERTGHDPLDGAGEVIRAAGLIRDQLPPELVPSAEYVDHDRVFSFELHLPEDMPDECPECGRDYVSVTGPHAPPNVVHMQVVPRDYCEYETEDGGGIYVHEWL